MVATDNDQYYNLRNLYPGIHLHDYNTSPLDYEGGDNIDAYQAKPISVVLMFTGDKFRKTINYPMIVELWERRFDGRVKRAWLKEFCAAERAAIGRWAQKFYRWHLITGAPQQIGMKLKTLELLQRAEAFFGSV